MSSKWSIAVVCLLPACRLDSVGPGPGPRPQAQGMVAGFVRDSAGQAVANAVVCATATFTVSNVPGIVTNLGATNDSGRYLVVLNLQFKVATLADLGVAATPQGSSGLAPASTSGLDVVIDSLMPPGDTTHVDLVVPAGAPYNGVLCVGP